MVVSNFDNVLSSLLFQCFIFDYKLLTSKDNDYCCKKLQFPSSVILQLAQGMEQWNAAVGTCLTTCRISDTKENTLPCDYP